LLIRASGGNTHVIAAADAIDSVKLQAQYAKLKNMERIALKALKNTKAREKSMIPRNGVRET
jgi:hypothetical protein